MKINKLISILLFIMLINIATVFSADIENSDLALLKRIGIFDELYQNDNIVTRGEMTKIVSHLIGAQGVGDNATTLPFFDVAQDNMFYKYIKIATDMGIVVGYEDNLFKPDSTIKYNEAVKMIVDALGYKELAEEFGAYPISYIITASKLKISTSINENKDSEDITVGKLSKLLVNALKVPLINKYVINNKQVATVDDTSSLLTSVFNINIVQGRVTKVYETGLTQESSLKQGQIVIANTTYDTTMGSDSYFEYLGRTVEAYIQTDSNSNESIVYMNVVKDAEAILEIKANQISSNDTEFSKTKIPYKTMDGNDEYAQTVAYPNVIYNMKALGSQYSVGNFRINSGNILLIDDNSDGLYETVIVSNYSSFQPGAELSEKGVSDFRDPSRALLLVENSYKNSVLVKQDGNYVGSGNIGAKQILSYFISVIGNKRIVSIVINTKEVEGEITEISTEENNRYVKVGEIKYKIAHDYIGKPITLGDKAQYYLDIDGNIAATFFKDNTTDINIGILLKVAEEEGLSTKVQFKIMDTDNVAKIYTLTDDVKIDAIRTSKLNDVITKLLETSVYREENNYVTNHSMGLYQQVIKYRLDNNKNIKEIFTSNYEGAEKFNEFSRVFTKKTYMNANNSFGREYLEFFVEANTKIFIMPNINSNVADSVIDNYMLSIEEVKNYAVNQKTDLVVAANLTDLGAYYAKAFGKKDNPMAEFLITKKANVNRAIDYNTYPSMLDKVVLTLNSDEEAVEKASIYNSHTGKGLVKDIIFNNKVNQYKIRESENDFIEISDIGTVLKPGDLFQFSKDNQENVNNIFKLFSVECPQDTDFKRYTSRIDNYQAQFRLVFGVVKEVKGNYLKLAVIRNSQDMANVSASNDDVIYEYVNMSMLTSRNSMYYFNETKGKTEYSNPAMVSDNIYALNKNFGVLIFTSMGMAYDLFAYDFKKPISSFEWR